MILKIIKLGIMCFIQLNDVAEASYKTSNLVMDKKKQLVNAIYLWLKTVGVYMKECNSVVTT